MASEQKTGMENVIVALQCSKLHGLGQAQKDALHKFKAAVAQAFGVCESAGVSPRTILAVMLLHSTSLATDEIAREMTGAASRGLQAIIGGGVCGPNLIAKLPRDQQLALHEYKAAVATAFGECEKVVSARIILTVFSEHSAELNVQDLIK